MPTRLVKIVNVNGRVGYVADTYPPLVRGALRRAPSERPAPPEQLDVPRPSRNASTHTWRNYARAHGLPSDEADAMTRDQLVAYFEEDSHAQDAQ